MIPNMTLIVEPFVPEHFDRKSDHKCSLVGRIWDKRLEVLNVFTKGLGSLRYLDRGIGTEPAINGSRQAGGNA